MMKSNKLKLITILVVLCVAIVGAFYLFIGKKNSELRAGQTNGTATFDENAYEAAPRQYLLKYMESISPGDYDKYFSFGNLSVDGKKIYAVYYIPNNSDTISGKIVENYNHPEDKKGPWRPGIIAFTKNGNTFSTIWESKEFFGAAGSVGGIEFKDIDDDGRDELTLTIGQGARLIPAIWIYKWDGKVFNLINPLPDKTTDEWMWDSEQMMAGISAELKNIAGDKYLEVFTTNTVNDVTVQRVYKFNGSNYYLWKEIPIK